MSTYTAREALTEHPDYLVNGIRFTNIAQRMIYEETPAGQSVPMCWHMNHKCQPPWHLRIEKIMRKCRVSWHEAAEIRDCLKVLNASYEILEHVAAAIREDGSPNATISALKIYTIELQALEPEPEGESPPEACWMGEYSRVNTRGPERVFRHLDALSAEEESGFTFDYGDPDLIDWFCRNRQTAIEDEEDRQSVFEQVEIDPADEDSAAMDRLNQAPRDLDDSNVAHYEAFGYHRVEGPALDWISLQPTSFRMLLESIRQCKDFSSIAHYGKLAYDNTWQAYKEQARREGLLGRDIQCLQALVTGRVNLYIRFTHIVNPELQSKFRLNEEGLARVIKFYTDHMPPLTKTQANVFWTYFNIARKRLHASPLTYADVTIGGKGSTAQKLIDRIIQIRDVKELGRLGKNLFFWQKGPINGKRANMAPKEWTLVWEYYKRHKNFLNNEPVCQSKTNAAALNQS